MPRIYDNKRSALDFCKTHFPGAAERYRYQKDADIDADHPDYEDTGYRCEICKKPLKTMDN